jgi:hypothetical protein
MIALPNDTVTQTAADGDQGAGQLADDLGRPTGDRSAPSGTVIIGRPASVRIPLFKPQVKVNQGVATA